MATQTVEFKDENNMFNTGISEDKNIQSAVWTPMHGRKNSLQMFDEKLDRIEQPMKTARIPVYHNLLHENEEKL